MIVSVRSGFLMALILCLGFLGTVLAAEPPSTGTGVVAREGIGGKAIALGGAFSALADDATAGYFNPAGLGLLTGLHLGGMYEKKFAPGSSFQYVSATVQLPSIGLGSGITLVRRSDTGIPYDGGIFDASDSLVLLSAGYDLRKILSLKETHGFALGTNLKIYASKGLEERRALGVGFDLAALFRMGFELWSLRLSYVSLDTLGSTIKWHGTLSEISEEVAWLHKLGVAIDFKEWNLSLASDLDISFAESDLNRFHLGAEYVLGGFSFRAGLNNKTPSLGLGVNILSGITIDLAVVFHGSIGQSYILSSEFSF